MRIGFVLCSAVVALTRAAVIAQSDATIPRTLLEHADRSPAALAWVLAAGQTPSGVEFLESDDATPPNDLRSEDPARVAAEEFVAAFNRAHRDYRAEQMSGVLVMRPVGLVLSFLDAISTIDLPLTVSGLPTAAMTAEHRVFGQLDARLLGPTISSSCRTDSDRITLRAEGGRRVIDLLNQIAVQSRAAWYVKTRASSDERRVVGFGVYYPNCRLNQPL